MVGTAPLYRESSPQASFQEVRDHTEKLAAPLSAEDQTVQSMPDVSPTKWHRAHTSWFFETFLLKEFLTGYQVFHPRFEVLFNSYYNSVGEQFSRPHRGLLSRPTCQQVSDYRAHVDEAMGRLLQDPNDDIARLVELGLHHEQQHQELLLTDIKHVLAQNPLNPAYLEEPVVSPVAPRDHAPVDFIRIGGGTATIGHSGTGFRFDNEGPQHQVLLDDFEIANRPINNAEVIAFIEAGGYDDPLLWLSDGWAFVKNTHLRHPLYWRKAPQGGFEQFSLHGQHPLNPAETASHLTYFEADAIARFLGARLPTEAEWEWAATRFTHQEATFDHHCIRPGVPAANPVPDNPLLQLTRGVWEWTLSPYIAYPRYQPPAGAVGEYNGKFMHNQMVLRGGSCATSDGHTRLTYRNFFPSHAQWQFTGARLARGTTAAA